ncbi:hypothetical protein Taro_041156, partial [Colocasia esculenta]|nr:hypothetical protein [Colocasia esculenta]
LGGTASVDTQADCVDTTGYWLQNRLLGGTVSVDTQTDCVDTTGYCFRTGFWKGQWKRYGYKAHQLADQAGLGTHTYLGPAIYSFSTPLLSPEHGLDSHVLYVERLSKCVDTQADCVDTTGYWLQNKLLGGTVSVDTQADYVDTTGYCFRTGFWEG